jgi:3-hydroxy-D-aspartate aldolase
MDAYRPLPGTPIEELDTPCLLIDLDAVERNFSVVADTFRGSSAKMRQHTKNTKSPRLARMQIDAGGTVGGVCTAKLAEAEVMVEGGVTDILIANQVVDRDKIARLCGLVRRADVKVCVDSEKNVRDLSETAAAQGVRIGVAIEVDTSMGRAGVRSKEEGVELAKLADSLPGVSFRGVMSHQHLDEFTDNENRILTAMGYYEICLGVRKAIEDAGIPAPFISSGETFSYDAAVQTGEPIEVEGGTYALMGTRYGYMEEFEIANKILITVVSTPRRGVAIGDAGTRAVSWPLSDPTVENMPGVTVDRMLEDHVVLNTDGTTPLNVGDKLVLLPFYQDMMVNRWDQYVAVRNGIVEEVWDIPGRGCYH